MFYTGFLLFAEHHSKNVANCLRTKRAREREDPIGPYKIESGSLKAGNGTLAESLDL